MQKQRDANTQIHKWPQTKQLRGRNEKEDVCIEDKMQPLHTLYKSYIQEKMLSKSERNQAVII